MKPKSIVQRRSLGQYCNNGFKSVAPKQRNNKENRRFAAYYV